MIHADKVENKAGRPCHDCGRLTWCMRQLCPWCDKKRREKAESEREMEMAELAENVRNKSRWNPGVQIVCESNATLSPIAKARIDEIDHKERIENEGMGMTLADG